FICGSSHIFLRGYTLIFLVGKNTIGERNKLAIKEGFMQMRKIARAAVLTTFSTLLGFVPLAVNAQQIPTNSVIICSSIPGGGKASFKLNGKVQYLKSGDCGTYSGASIFLFYTEYGRNPRYVLQRQLAGGGQYDFQKTKSGDLDVVPVKFIPK
ncbi:MAG: hypothetical protein WCO29_09670, partial [Nostocales cyanobacterium ELA583]